MSMTMIDAPVIEGATYALQGDGRTYLLDKESFEAAMDAARSVADGRETITTGEAADILHVSARTVARILDSGRIRFFRNGDTGHRLMRRDDVIAYRDEQTRRRTALSEARDAAEDAGLYDIDPSTLPTRTRRTA